MAIGRAQRHLSGREPATENHTETSCDGARGLASRIADNETDSIGSAPAEEWRGATDGGAGALRIEFIERSRNQSLGIEWFFAADRAEWST